VSWHRHDLFAKDAFLLWPPQSLQVRSPSSTSRSFDLGQVRLLGRSVALLRRSVLGRWGHMAGASASLALVLLALAGPLLLVGLGELTLEVFDLGDQGLFTIPQRDDGFALSVEVFGGIEGAQGGPSLACLEEKEQRESPTALP
jgi:hypothetical protein